MRAAPPLRFVGVVLGGWISVRAALLVPAWSETKEAAFPEEARTEPVSAHSPPREVLIAEIPAKAMRSVAGLEKARRDVAAREVRRSFALHSAAPMRLPSLPTALSSPAPARPFQQALRGTAPMPLSRGVSPPALGRWSTSAWAFVRRGDGAALAAGGMLGGSQAGARLSYRLNDDPGGPVALTARLYAPLAQAGAAEAAVGVEWKPWRAVPVTLLAERRQAVGKKGRSAFALTAYGGLSEVAVLGPLALDAYVQAGVVGTKSRDLFADGSASVSLPVGDGGRLRLGAGFWGAAQPGVARLDAGPQVSYRLPLQDAPVRLSVEWRQRISGHAAPASGPALTLSTGF